MIWRIEIFFKIFDPRAEVFKKKIEKNFGKKIKKVRIIDVYTIEKNLNFTLVKKIAQALTNPLTQSFLINSFVEDFRFKWALEIGFLPGVTDNVGNTAKEIIEDLLNIKFVQNEVVYTSKLYLIDCSFNPKEIFEVASGLINPLIQRFSLKSAQEYQKDKGMEKIIPRVKLEGSAKASYVDLEVSEEELTKIGKEGIVDSDGKRRGPLALDLLSMKKIQTHFRKLGRKPTDVELESIAQTWSEHCKHTIFANPLDEIKEGLFRSFIKRATEEICQEKGKKDFCVSVFTDNSGAIEFNKDYLITHKIETHNSPSALDPFGGAITGIVGVNRDTLGFGLGAKPIANVYGFCFASPKSKKILYRDRDLSQKVLSPRRIMEGVIEGVQSGGNCSGIPTPLGFLYFDQRFRGKPLVFVGTVGLIPKKNGERKLFKKGAKPGDYIVMIGGRVGLDGIHGVTFSSEALSSGSPASAVQIGDPITQKKFSDALVREARDLNLYNSITDNGAGGLSCSVAEMAKESGGCQVNLEKVPLKYLGLSPWQIWISESQERMTLAVPPKKWEKFFKLMESRGVEANIIGKFTNSGHCIVKYKNKVVMDLEMDFLHYGLPYRSAKTISFLPRLSKKKPLPPKDLTNLLCKILSRPNIASFEFISSQYDHEVQGTSVLKPLIGKGRINAQTVVIRPVLSSKRGIVLSYGIYPSYSDIDTYWMAMASLDTAVRNIVACGADFSKIALLDNFCWSSSNQPKRLFQLKRAVQACYELATFYKTPFISGKDSMFNDFKGYTADGHPIKISAPPTLLISSLGILRIF